MRNRILFVVLLIQMPNMLCASAVKSVTELEYGAVLFEYYQQQYFSALVEQEYAFHSGNSLALKPAAAVLKGGMMLSYGIADDAKKIFQPLLGTRISKQVSNGIWFYLAKLYYQKNEINNASDALQNIKGKVPDDIHSQYHYLATLINIRGSHLSVAENIIAGALKSSAYEPYLLYNLAISQMRSGDIAGASANFQLVTLHADQSEEMAVLSDRARHGLATLALKNNQFAASWLHLQSIRTSGLYSNRALLSYGWSAIKVKQFEKAIPALRMLEGRSIAIAEVQEAKVLLPHLYEQQGASRKALKGYLMAEKAFKGGVDAVDSARNIIAMRDVPEEFVSNLELISGESDWYGSQPDVNYKKLSPFLVDLMASNVFQTTLKELGDLYALRKNLRYWSGQAVEHERILNRKISELTAENIQESALKSEQLKAAFDNKKVELKLYTLTLDADDQKRFKALLETTAQAFDSLENQIGRIKKIDRPYAPTYTQIKKIRVMHKRISNQLKQTNHYIDTLEPVMRDVVNAELDKHEERMRYYWAQARLAKARLYDSELDALEQLNSDNSQQSTGGVNK